MSEPTWRSVDMGAVTSYALAVEAGFEGTEDDFARLLANVANYSERAIESAEDAAESAEEADEAAELAEGYKESARQAKIMAEEAQAAAQAAAASEVSSWLERNIDPQTGYAVDKTLTVSNAAADAKTTGTKINKITPTIEKIEGVNYRIVLKLKDGSGRTVVIDPGELFNGIYSTADGFKNTTYKYGLSNNLKIDISQYESATVECEGAYIRVFRFPQSTVEGFDYTEYIQDSVTVEPTQLYTRMAFTVRLDPSVSTALTQEEITTLTSKLLVKGEMEEEEEEEEEILNTTDRLRFEGIDFKLMDKEAREEAASKISEPETEGTAGQVLTTNGNGGRSWTNVQGGGGGTIELVGTVDPGELFNGIYSTADGFKNTNYKYGLSNNIKIKADQYDSVTIECQGAYIRAFRFPESSIAGYDFTEYKLGSVTVEPTAALPKIAFTIRLNPDDNTALTQAQINTLMANLSIKGKVVEVTDRTKKVAAGGDLRYVNGIYSSTSGCIITNHPYGYALATPIEMGESGSVTVSCDGYMIRLIRFKEGTRDGFSLEPGYIKNVARVSGTSTLTRFAFTVCKENSDNNPLTEEQAREIREKLVVVYTFTQKDRNRYTEKLINDAGNYASMVGSPRLFISQVPSESGILNATSEDVYDRYDAMCLAHPEWIQRQEDIGEDSDENPIRHYIVRMFDPIVGYQEAYTNEVAEKVNYWKDKFKYRRIFINAGVHGNEKSSVWALVYFLEMLISSTEEWARFIRANFVLDIIPILNVWGYDNNSRNNKNDVNVNRDYLTDPASMQAETRTITTYIQSIKDDIFCAIDMHTTGGLMNYVASNESNPMTGTLARLTNQVVGACVHEWGPIANSLGSDVTHYPYCYYCLSTNTGTMHHYMVVNEITNYTCTIEGFKQETDEGLVKITKFILDLVLNMIMGFAQISQSAGDKLVERIHEEET